jgi:aminopeptidase N
MMVLILSAVCSFPVFSLSDPHSFSRPEEARITHLDLDLRLDFEKRVIHGTAILHFQASPDARALTLDTRDLLIHRVTLDDEDRPAAFSLGMPDEVLGQGLEIRLKPGSRKVKVVYETSPEAAALQWLAPQQTAGGRMPFLYTQSQAILCRSWIPIQDSPGIRFTYTARVTTQPGMLALMSAMNPQKMNPEGVYEFEMPHPIPAYLMALASGRLEFGELDERTGVYAEPETLPLALKDFSDTPHMLMTAERLYGTYPWGRYDILVMPPSFPFGGMENPCLTFATPTILTGDKSLTSLIAHELAHSWSGNLATNATWNDFWLNEGFTVFLERRIMEELYGRDYADMLEVLGYSDLLATLEELGKEDRINDTCLRLHLEGRDPDDGMNDIAYEKGYLFLRQIQRLLGTKSMDNLLKKWFSLNAFKSVTTEQFVAFLKRELSAEIAQKTIPSDWIYGTGLPPHEKPHSKAFEWVEDAAKEFINSDRMPARWNSWNSHERQHFLRYLFQASLTPDRLARLDEALGLTRSSNAEELFIWFQMALKAGYMDVLPRLDEFLSQVGRRKFVLPLIRSLLEQPALKSWVVDRFYSAWRRRYHAVTARSVEKLMS